MLSIPSNALIPSYTGRCAATESMDRFSNVKTDFIEILLKTHSPLGEFYENIMRTL